MITSYLNNADEIIKKAGYSKTVDYLPIQASFNKIKNAIDAKENSKDVLNSLSKLKQEIQAFANSNNINLYEDIHNINTPWQKIKYYA